MSLVLSSCDRNVYIRYVVSNDSDSSIVVHYRGPDSTIVIHRPDSTVIVVAGKSQELFVRSDFSNRVYDPEYESDTLWYVPYLEILRPDGTRLTKDYHLSKYWNYEAQSAASATKTAHVSAADFVK